MSYMGPQIWDLVPKQTKQVTTLDEFKIKIWKLKDCPYRLSRTYLPQICFITWCFLTQTNVVRLRARGTLSGNASTAVISTIIKLTLRKSWAILWGIFCHCCYYYFVNIAIFLYLFVRNALFSSLFFYVIL